MSSAFNYLLYHFPYLQDVHTLALLIILDCVAAGIFVLFILLFSMCATWLNRKISVRIQQIAVLSHGHGWDFLTQPFKDALKLFFKQDIMPLKTDKTLFHFAPLLVFVPVITLFAVAPFGDNFYVANLNIGIFYMLAAIALSSLGLIMAGIASDGKWSLYGALREAAYIISCIIPLGLSLVSAIMTTGSLNMQEFISAQDGGIRNWLIVRQFPFNFLSFAAYFIVSLGIIKRNPFETSGENSDIVAGVYTEYSGLRLGLFYVARYALMFILAAVSIIIFWGGWQSPVSTVSGIPQMIWFFIKIVLMIAVQLWIHWSLPRVRTDQAMQIFWKIMVPLSLISIIGTGILMTAAKP